MASVSSAGRVTIRYPPATSTMASPRACSSYRAVSAATSSWAASAVSRSRTSRMRSASSGASEANSRASTTSIGLGTGSLPHGRRGGLAFDDDVSEELGLLRLDPTLAHELEHGQQRDHHLGPLALPAGQRREQERPGVAQHRQDLGHALEHRRRIGLDVARARALLLLDQPLHRALEPVDAEIL